MRGCQELTQLACEAHGLQVALRAAVQASRARRGLQMGTVQFDLCAGDLDDAEDDFFPEFERAGRCEKNVQEVQCNFEQAGCCRSCSSELPR